MIHPEQIEPTLRMAIVAFSALIFLSACGRQHIETREFPLAGGTCLIEQWDDPVDNLKSHRILWHPDGAGKAEFVHEIWGSLDHSLEPGLEGRNLLTLVLGEHCFEREPPGLWRLCQSQVVY